MKYQRTNHSGLKTLLLAAVLLVGLTAAPTRGGPDELEPLPQDLCVDHVVDTEICCIVACDDLRRIVLRLCHGTMYEAYCRRWIEYAFVECLIACTLQA